jgi:hypothetical protein
MKKQPCGILHSVVTWKLSDVLEVFIADDGDGHLLNNKIFITKLIPLYHTSTVLHMGEMRVAYKF